MRKLDIIVQVLSEVTSRDKTFVEQLFASIFAARPEAQKGFLVEISDAEAKKMLADLRAEGPGILARLQKEASNVEAMGSKTAQ